MAIEVSFKLYSKCVIMHPNEVQPTHEAYIYYWPQDINRSHNFPYGLTNSNNFYSQFYVLQVTAMFSAQPQLKQLYKQFYTDIMASYY